MKTLAALSTFQQVVGVARVDIATTPSELRLELRTTSPMPAVFCLNVMESKILKCALSCCLVAMERHHL